MDHSKSMGGADVDEARRRAKHRGRAYQCLACFHKEGKNTINEKGKIEFHILKNHFKLDEVPFYCRLCLFVCLKRDQLEKHVKGYQRHIEMAKKRGVTNHSECLVESSHPYKMSQLDYRQLSTEESISYFTKQSLYKLDKDTRNPINVAINRMITGEIEEDLDMIEADLAHPSKSTQKQITSTEEDFNRPVTISIPEVGKGIDNSTAFDMAESLIGTSNQPKDSLHSFNTDLVLTPSLSSSFCEMLSSAAAPSFTATPFSEYPSPNKALNTPKNYQTNQLDKDDSEESTDKELNVTNTLNLPTSKFVQPWTSSPKIQHGMQEPKEPTSSSAHVIDEMNENPLPSSTRYGFKVKKRSVPPQDDIEDSPKRLKVDLADLNERTLVAVVGRLAEAVEYNTKALNRIEKYAVDNSIMMSKMIEVMSKLNKTLESREHQEELREERRCAYDERRDEERRRDSQMWRHEEERRREIRRREDKENNIFRTDFENTINRNSRL